MLIALIAIFVVLFFIFRGLGSDAPVAGGSTTTLAAGESTSTTGGSSTTTESGVDGTTSTSAGETAGTLDPLKSVTLDTIYEGMQRPTALAAPIGDDRLFVVQQVGVIRILDENRNLVDPAFLDLTDRVLAGGIEQGLLGLAFHPDYANNRRFFVYYTDKGGRRQLSEFTTSISDPNFALPDTEKVIFEYEQPEGHTDIRHYAGNVAFGPDGYLWVSMGDGADSRDQGQDPNTPYGTIVRIDVDNGDPYSIPPDNPFVDGGGLADVWAYGLRNPWRFSIDPVDRLVYIGDVGQSDLEEINVVPLDDGGGYNFGWADMEGTRCFFASDCDPANYTSPVVTYTHEEGLSVTGGYVYRGAEIPEIDGVYFYSDYASGWFKSFRWVDGQVTDQKDWTAELGGAPGQVTSFGLDGHGEMYALTFEGGVYKFTAIR